jgi:sugar-specific transcriptional regulator TrmB
MQNIQSSLQFFNLKDRAQKVFIYLAQEGVSPVSAIANKLPLPKASIYDALEDLKQESLIVEYSANRSKEYGLVSQPHLKDLIAQKMKSWNTSHENLFSFLNNAEEGQSEATKPKITFYQGQSGIRQAFRDNMWNNKTKESYLLWSVKDMLLLLGVEFNIWHSEGRRKNNVHLSVIGKESDREVDTLPELAPLVNMPNWNVNCETRYMPKETTWSMGYWVYGDTCLFATPGAENFAFTVKSQEFADMMIMLFKQAWKETKK